MKHKIHFIIILFCLSLSCNEKSSFIPVEKNRIIDILTALQIKSASLEVSKSVYPDSLAKVIGYRMSLDVLKEYDIDSAFFIQSMEYYLNDEEMMGDIYAAISSKIENQIDKLEDENKAEIEEKE